MGKKKNAKEKQEKHESSYPNAKGVTTPEKLNRKAYETELARVHVELVELPGMGAARAEENLHCF